MGFRMPETSRAVGCVQDDRLVTKTANEPLRLREAGDLFRHVLWVGVRGRKVSHETRDSNRRESPKLPKELAELAERHA